MVLRALSGLVAASLLRGGAPHSVQELDESPTLQLKLGYRHLQRLGQRGQRVLRKASARLEALPRVAQVLGAAGAGSLLLPGAAQEARGMVRGLRFWRHAVPIYWDYRLTARRLRLAGPRLSRRDRDLVWQKLHEKHAPHLLDMILELRGFYVKVGQVCSTRSDMFPKPWTDQLEGLQGGRPDLLARPMEEVKRILDHDLGHRMELLARIDWNAVGAAATGQVHRAWLQDGEEVVVKVQYPEASRLFRQDFSTVKTFCRLLQPEHLPYIQELEQQFATEFNYLREAEDLAAISANFEEGTGNPYATKVRIPTPVPELSSQNIVVMEYLPGETLLQYARRRKREVEQSSWLSMLWRGWFLRRELQAYLTLLINVQGYQIFIDGVFNGDPHPGNVLKMPDGRLGLIDYGNVKRLSLAQRADLARLIIALAKGQRAAVCAGASALGFRTRQGNQDALFRYATLWFDRDDAKSTTLPNGERPGNVQVYLERLMELDPLDSTPEGFLMVARNSFLLRGLGTHLGMAVRTAERWRPLAEQALQAAEAKSSAGQGSAFALGGRRSVRGAAAARWI